MKSLCDKLEAFVDGELEPADAENFRHHLVDCAACDARLTELMALELLADDAVNGADARAPVQAPPKPARSSGLHAVPPLPPQTETAPPPPPEVTRARPRWSRRATWAAGVPAALAASVLAVVMVSRTGSRSGDADLWLARGDHRTLEARLTHPGADGYRPYRVMRGGDEKAPALSLRELARLEEDGDSRGIATAYLVRGDLAQASSFLDKLPESPDLAVDRAVLALQKGHPEDALTLLEHALKQRERHPQALWNRGLALQAMGLSLLAAESFDAVAALKEPGWSEEAVRRAEALRAAAMEERKSWEGMKQDCRRMVAGESLLTEQQAEAHPGLARLCLYDAARAASTPERVEALRPLATRLDRLDGGTHLEDLLRRTASQDFTVRAPLAADYARLTRGELPSTDLGSFLKRLRDARQEDLLLGALLFVGDPRPDLNEYRTLALATKDPWFALLAEERKAKADVLAGDSLRVQERLSEALRACEGNERFNYRCMGLERELGLALGRLHRPLEARAHLLRALQRARAGREWGTQWGLLQDLGQVARARGDFTLAQRYLAEALLQKPENCSEQEVGLTSLGVALQRALDFAGARAHLDRATRCGSTSSMARVALLADLARTPFHRPEDEHLLTQGMASLRSGGLGPGEDALLVHLEGRFHIEQDRQRGQALLRRAIDAASRLPASDVSGRKARAYSYSSLILDAGRHSEWERALALFGEEHAVPVPPSCVLGVTVEDERTLLVARDARGQLVGRYDDTRKTPFTSAADLVPAQVVDALRDCERVDVLARPPVQGSAGLLPSELAWSYRVGQPSREAPAPAERRLVVTDVLTPSFLGLPTLSAWNGPATQGGGLSVLRGASATPSRVLEAMRDVTELQIHAHGMIDPSRADASLLVLSPEGEGGRFALTTQDVRGQHLGGHPVVLLAACYAAHTTGYLHETFGLPVVFIESGARAVLAATQEIPDTEAADFFEPVLARIRAGEDAARVLRDERQAWLGRHKGTWVRQVLLFE